MSYGPMAKWTRFALQQVNSQKWIARCRDGWALVDELEDTDLYTRRGEAEARLQEFKNWLGTQRDFYTGGYWGNCFGGLNVVIELDVTFTQSERSQ